ncbi:MAG: LamG-like jellyroll fold domain-containing protein, partial [Armatimonadota bacterium]
MKRIAILALVLTSTALFAQDDPALLHVSWEGTQTAESARGRAEPTSLAPDSRHDFGPGQFGQAFVLLHRGSVGPFDAAGNFSVRSGSLAMWYRPHRVHGELNPVRVTSIDRGYYYQLMRVRLYAERLESIFYDDYRGWNGVSGSIPTLQEGEWVHLGFVWDSSQGQRLYVNGEQIASTWGEQSWPTRSVFADEIEIPVRPSRPVDGRGDAVDELWTFSRPLTGEEMRLLYEQNRPPGPAPVEQEPDDITDRRRAQFGWDDGALPVLPGGSALCEVPLTEVYQGTKRVGYAADGKVGTYHPHRYHGEFDGGGCLGVGLAGDFDHMALVGRYDGFIYPGRHDWTPEDVQPRWDVDMDGPGVYRRAFDGDEVPRELTFEGGRGTICELDFFRVEEPAWDDAQRETFALRPADPTSAAGELAPELFSQYPGGDRASLAPGGEAGALAIPAGRFLHVLLPPQGETLAIDGIELRIPAQEFEGEVACNIALSDPISPWRRHLFTDALVECDGALDLRLDTVDLMLQPDQRLWLTIALGEDLRVDPAEPPELSLVLGDEATVAEEYVRYRMRLLKSLFNELSEPRGWQRHREEKNYQVLFRMIDDLKQYIANDPRLIAIRVWCEEGEWDVPVELPDIDAPRWALLGREIMRHSRDAALWWARNRQLPNGEFGDNINDDTCFVNVIPAIGLIYGPAPELTRSIKGVASVVHDLDHIERGLNRRATDTLHAYEDGFNVQQQAHLLDWGNPLYLERMMETARRVDEDLLAVNPLGHTLMRSGHFGAYEVIESPDASDSMGNWLVAHPALALAYYNRNPRSMQMLQAWADSWIEIIMHNHEAGMRGTRAVRWRDEKVTRDWTVPYSGRGFGDTLLALWQLTGEERYTEPAQLWLEADQFLRPGWSDAYPFWHLGDEAKFEQMLEWMREYSDELLLEAGSDALGGHLMMKYHIWE